MVALVSDHVSFTVLLVFFESSFAKTHAVGKFLLEKAHLSIADDLVTCIKIETVGIIESLELLKFSFCIWIDGFEDLEANLHRPCHGSPELTSISARIELEPELFKAFVFQDDGKGEI